MPANWKTFLVYGVTWHGLWMPAVILVGTAHAALHGMPAGQAFAIIIHSHWKPGYEAVRAVEMILSYSFVMGIAFRTLNVRVIQWTGDSPVRVLFVSGGVGLVFYLLFLVVRWPDAGTWSLAEGLPSLLAAVGAGFALRFVWPRPFQAQPAAPPGEGVWPPPPRSPE